MLGDSLVRINAARAAASIDTARILAMKIVSDRAFGTVEPAHASLYRILAIGAERTLMEFGFELLGLDGLVDGTPYDRQFRWGMTSGVAGGTLEMQLNTVARAIFSPSAPSIRPGST
jgi:alkylation response protein AidB-like acyl-CoA dehydrogenase